MNRRASIAAIASVAVLALLALVFLRPHPSTAIEASGVIEATQSDVAPKTQGRLLRLPVRDGDRVRRGAVVAVLEQVNPSLTFDQARANVAAALAQVDAAQAAYDLQHLTYRAQLDQAGAGVSMAGANLGAAQENLAIEMQAASLRVEQAQAQLVAARSAYDRATIELSRDRALVTTGDEPQRALDDASAQYRAASAQLKTAIAAVALAQADRRNVQIRELGVRASHSQQREALAALDTAQAQAQFVAQRRAQLLAAQAQLAQARAAAGLARDQLHETRVTAPFDGYVVSHNFEVGDLISAGSPVMTIADLVHPYLNVYVSETDLPRVKTGMRADVTIDGMPGQTFTGTVTEIAGTAEFTPENVQTKEQRTEYLVFRVKIQFTDTTGTLKPGLPADAIIRA